MLSEWGGDPLPRVFKTQDKVLDFLTKRFSNDLTECKRIRRAVVAAVLYRISASYVNREIELLGTTPQFATFRRCIAMPPTPARRIALFE